MPTPVPGPLPLELPVRPLSEVSWLQAHLAYAPVKALLPLPILAAVAPAIWWFFRDTWRELDREAARHRGDLVARGLTDYRPDAYADLLIGGQDLINDFGSLIAELACSMPAVPVETVAEPVLTLDEISKKLNVTTKTINRWRKRGLIGLPVLVNGRRHVGFLPSLVELGVTAIELMPLNDFPGQRNWGYDGVLPFAPDSSYGRPDDLKALIDAAHGLGLREHQPGFLVAAAADQHALIVQAGADMSRRLAHQPHEGEQATGGRDGLLDGFLLVGHGRVSPAAFRP